MDEHSIHDLQTAWRAAERRLEDATDSATAEELAYEVERLREEYRRAVHAVDADDVKAHGQVRDTG